MTNLARAYSADDSSDLPLTGPGPFPVSAKIDNNLHIEFAGSNGIPYPNIGWQSPKGAQSASVNVSFVVGAQGLTILKLYYMRIVTRRWSLGLQPVSSNPSPVRQSSVRMLFISTISIPTILRSIGESTL
jgi:hypothetical protein